MSELHTVFGNFTRERNILFSLFVKRPVRGFLVPLRACCKWHFGNRFRSFKVHATVCDAKKKHKYCRSVAFHLQFNREQREINFHVGRSKIFVRAHKGAFLCPTGGCGLKQTHFQWIHPPQSLLCYGIRAKLYTCTFEHTALFRDFRYFEARWAALT